jgi:solute carrier family 25 carnitine/acylcarnitine transporter 20/29
MGEAFHFDPGPKKFSFPVETREAIAGLVGSVCCTYTTLPMDLLKVRLQTSASQFKGTSDALLHALRSDGIRSLWRGASAALTACALENTVLFSLNGFLRRTATQNGQKKLTFAEECGLGAMCGVVSATVVSPTEVIKCRMQVTREAMSRSGQAAPNGLLPTITNLWREHGVRGFYRGLPLMYARDIPFFMIYFANYQKYISLAMAHEGITDKSDLPVVHVMLGGGLAGCASWALTLPLDNLTTRAQTVGLGKAGLRNVLVDVVRKEGLFSLWTGFTPCMSRAFAYSAALFLGVELTERFLTLPMWGKLPASFSMPTLPSLRLPSIMDQDTVMMA